MLLCRTHRRTCGRFFFFSSRRRHTRLQGDWSSDVCSSDLESDRSFLKLFPTIAVITNIDHEHLENYGGFDDLQQAFVDFANKVPFYGSVVVCADDPNLSAIVPRMTRRGEKYGLGNPRADVTPTGVGPSARAPRATL